MKLITHYPDPGAGPFYEFVLPLDLDTEHFDLTEQLPPWFKQFDGLSAEEVGAVFERERSGLKGEGAIAIRDALLKRPPVSITLFDGRAGLALNTHPEERFDPFEVPVPTLILRAPCAPEDLDPTLPSFGIDGLVELFRCFGDIQDTRQPPVQTFFPRTWNEPREGMVPLLLKPAATVWLDQTGWVGEMQPGGRKYRAGYVLPAFDELDDFLLFAANDLSWPDERKGERYFTGAILE